MCGCSIISCDSLNTPLNLAMYETLAPNASYCALHFLYWFVPLLLFYGLFGSSRVDTTAEQFEQQFEYHPEEDIVGFSTADLTCEPTFFTYFIVSCSLFYCYPYVAILLCHVSYSTCYPIWAVLPLRYLLPVVCCLSSLASRSACLGSCCYLDMFEIFVGKLTHETLLENAVDNLLQLKLLRDNN